MSRQNVELFRRGMDASHGHDLEPLLEMSHPEIAWFPFSAQVEGDVAYQGHEGVRMWWANLNATFEEFEATIEVGWVVRFRDGLAVWGRAYQSHAEALEAAGLSE